MVEDGTVGDGGTPMEFRTRIVQDGYSYWRSKTTEDRLPARGDINPVEIPRLMPHVVIMDVEREPELDFRYRLIGTYVVEHLYADHTGKSFAEIGHQKAPSQIWSNCKRVVETGEAFLADTPYVGPHQSFRNVEDIILPLATDGTNVDALLVFICYSSMGDN